MWWYQSTKTEKSLCNPRWGMHGARASLQAAVFIAPSRVSQRIFAVFTRDSIYAIERICYRPSVCLSVTRVDQSKTVEARITIFWSHSSPIPLVFRGKVSSRNSGGSPRAVALNESGVGKIGDFRTLSRHISEMVQDRTKVAIDH